MNDFLLDNLSSSTTKQKPTDDYTAGHRHRLRDKLLNNPDSLPDYELLELILTYALPRKDVKPLAKDLLKTFGSFSNVLYAPEHKLYQIPFLKENSVALFKAIQTSVLRILKQDVSDAPVLQNFDKLINYCKAKMVHSLQESFHVFYLDNSCHLICDETMQKGTIDQTPIYPREILKRALDLGAVSVILCHNHPSGDVSPSKADILMTHKTVDVLSSADIQVLDHVIVSKKSYCSFKSCGLLYPKSEPRRK
jgi:DNA repair protein RadC